MDTKYTTCSIAEDDFTRQTFFNLEKVLFKSLGLILICLLSFGIFFCYDNPGALQDKFETDLNMPASKFSVLYAVYAWPNVILCFFGGFLLDSVFGIRWGTIIYLGVALCGQLLFALGAYVDIFWLMILGRFIFGMGAESVNIAQNGYIVMWFSGKALNTLFGLQWSFSQVASTVNALAMGNIYKLVSETLNYSGHECVGIVLFLAAITCLGSITCAIILSCMNRSSGKITKQNEDKPPELVKVTDIKDFKLTFWLIVLICAAYYVTIYSFTALAKLYFMTKYKFESDAANKATSMIYSISAITSPLFGILIDKIGRNILWVVVSIICSSITRGLLAFTYVSPYVCMVMLGLSSSIFTTSAWPMIANVMPEHQLGTAYGINQAVLNLSIAVTSIICGNIVDEYGYFILDLFFLAWVLMALIPAVIILISYPESTDKTYDVVERPDASKDLLVGDLLRPSVINMKDICTPPLPPVRVYDFCHINGDYSGSISSSAPIQQSIK